MNRFQLTLQRRNSGRPPVWFMRQAGRYHAHYQALRARYSFMDLCKLPDVATEVTMGPIEDFDFDAAILFSDLLFPLEAMGMPLRYDPGPKLDWHLTDRAQLTQLRGGEALARHMDFQAVAMRQIRARLPKEKGLIGFVGGPLTLFYYAAAGSHQGGQLETARSGLKDGRFHGFCELLIDLLAENMALQARAGADTIAVMDTCAGEITPEEFREFEVPALREVFRRFKAKCPETPITYYSKGTGPAYWDTLTDLPISAIGFDWNNDLAAALERYGDRWAIQGNFDPNDLFLPTNELQKKIDAFFRPIQALSASRRQGWICGLGHGVLPKTPEEHVRLFLRMQKERFQ